MACAFPGGGARGLEHRGGLDAGVGSAELGVRVRGARGYPLSYRYAARDAHEGAGCARAAAATAERCVERAP